MEVHIWTGAELLERNAAKRRAPRSLLFALAPKATAWTLMAAMLGLSAAPAGAVAKPPPKDPVIKLPPAPGGESDGQEDNAPDGQGTEEDAPEPPPPPPPPAAESPPPPAEPPPAEPPPPAATPQPSTQAPPASEQPSTPPAQQQPPPAATPPPAEPQLGPVTPPAEPAPAPPAPVAAPAPAGPALRADIQTRQRKDRAERRRTTRAAPAPRPAPRPATAEPTSATAASTPASRQVVRVSARKVARVAGSTHTVRAGDTLWAIAERMLGPGATDARVGALVGELWALNADEIGTGAPDELPVGVTLRLPSIDTGGKS